MHLKVVMYIHNCYIDTRDFGPAVSWKTTGEFFLLFPHNLLHLMSQHKAKLSILSIFQHSCACVQLRKKKRNCHLRINVKVITLEPKPIRKNDRRYILSA